MKVENAGIYEMVDSVMSSGSGNLMPSHPAAFIEQVKKQNFSF